MMISNEGYQIDFGISLSDMSKPESLKRAFLQTIIVTEDDFAKGYLTLDDGTEWPFYPEETLQRRILDSIWPQKAIVSFQVHDWGKAAIGRLYKELKGVVK